MIIDKNNVTAVILAGGKGRRLEGQDKGLVNYKNRPLIEHVIERVKPQVERVMINANRHLDVYQGYGFSVFKDELSHFQGPLAGLASAMNLVSTDYIVTLPCDGPLLPLDLVSKMLTALNQHKSDNGIVVAHDGERLQPVHALVPIALRASLLKFLEGEDRKIINWYANHPLIHCDFSAQPEAFFNINTAGQLQQ